MRPELPQAELCLTHCSGNTGNGTFLSGWKSSPSQEVSPGGITSCKLCQGLSDILYFIQILIVRMFLSCGGQWWLPPAGLIRICPLWGDEPGKIFPLTKPQSWFSFCEIFSILCVGLMQSFTPVHHSQAMPSRKSRFCSINLLFWRDRGTKDIFGGVFFGLNPNPHSPKVHRAHDKVILPFILKKWGRDLSLGRFLSCMATPGEI